MSPGHLIFKFFLVIFSGVQAYPSTNNPINLQPVNPELNAVTRRFNYFDLELLKEFSESAGNVFISPASIKTTMALIMDGAKGNSAQEIGNALRINDINDQEIREILGRLLFDLNNGASKTTLKATTSLFISNKYNLLPEYANKLTAYYKGTAKNVDFSDANKAASFINSWVFNATDGFIQNIVDSESFEPDMSMMISNVLYFKGKWKTQFDPSDTFEKCFYSPTRGCVKTPIMQVSHQLNYDFNTDLNAYAIELPYEDDKYAMLVLVPNNGNNVRILARDMQHTQLANIIAGLSTTELIFEMPRFEIEYQTELVSFLEPLRIREIFGPNANLTGIVGKENIRVSSILHKTRVEVNEQGTKAAAASAAVVVPLMGSQKITADRPFVFFIYHKESQNIIFEGIFSEPSSGTPRKTAPLNRPQFNVQ